MIHHLSKLAIAASLTILVLPLDAFAGGRGGGGSRGGSSRRGGDSYGSGGGYGGGGMSHSPSFSQPHSSTGASSNAGRNPYGDSSGSGSRNSSSNAGAAAAGAEHSNNNQSSNHSNAGAAAAGAGASNRKQSNSPSTAGAAAAGAGAANRNQSPSVSNAGAAAAGAGAANRNQSPNVSNAGAAAAGAGAANRNQSPNMSNAGAAAAGAGYANRNQSPGMSNAGAAAAGAGYANRNQSPNMSNAGAAAAGAGYANRNQYDAYHPGMAAGSWNGNYGVGNVAAYGGLGMASTGYGYGGSTYANPYVGSALGGNGVGQPAAPAQAGGSYNYSQPLNPSAAPANAPRPDPTTSPIAQARQAFQAGDYATSLQLTQQALGQMPNDVTLHEFLALNLFAQGNYEQAAAPLYAVLSVGPGWNWTTLIGNYSDASVYTKQLRGLEAFVRENPKSAKAQFVEAYHYICQGQGQAAIKPLENVVVLQPSDTVSAQLLSKLQPIAAGTSARPDSIDPTKLMGVWVAQAPQNATIKLTVADEGAFTWEIAASGKPPMKISGGYTLANGVLTLNGKDAPGGPLMGDVALADDNHLSFKAVGAPPSDPGLQFAR